MDSKSPLRRIDSISTTCTERPLSSASSVISEGVLGDLADRGVSWTPANSARSLLHNLYIQACRPTKAQIARGVVIPHLFENAQRREDPVIRGLIEQAMPLSRENFYEDVLSNVNNKSGQRFLLYCSEDMQTLWGFAVYKLKPQSGILALGKLAVPEYLRGLGFGTFMLKELIKLGKSVPALDTMALSSLPGAIAFYRKLGFKLHAGALRAEDDDTQYIEGQVYMDHRFRKGKLSTGGKAKKRR
jgi:ribosomal protein S18 acetylase RimI-like enzyme